MLPAEPHVALCRPAAAASLLDGVSRIPRVPTAIITVTAVLTAGLAVLTLGRDASAADGDPPIVHLVSADANQGSAHRSSVSSDGRWAAFESEVGETRSIFLRTLDEQQTIRLPGLEDMSAAMPTMSGDAGLIAFAGGRFGSGWSDPLHEPQLYVVNRRTPDAPVLKPVTGAPNDLPYQRFPSCEISNDGDDTECAPKLSRDGTTLVAPVTQSIDSPDLEVTIDGANTNTSRGTYPVMDFGAFNTSGESTVTVQNVSSQPMVYPDTGPVLEGDSQFTVLSSTCAGTLSPNASCSATVKYTGTDCTVESSGVLRFPAAAAPGQTAVRLAAGGECPRLSAFPPRAAAAANCTGPSQYQGPLPLPEPSNESGPGHPQPWFVLNSITAGQPGIRALQIRNEWSVPLIPTLSSPGCRLKFVLPDGAPDDTCRPGQPIAPQTNCRAYVEYDFAEVEPFAGTFRLGDTVSRIGGHAARDVVAAWRDVSASGNFGPAKIISTTGANGVPMDGRGPTISADGRWVGYSSTSYLGRPAGDPRPFFRSSQIYVHDTDAAGDRTYQPGETTVVSFNGAGALEGSAWEPSISDDGSRIAFGLNRSDNESDQVWVRDLIAKKSIRASSTPTGAASSGGSEAPELSGDGHTVAYISSADDLGVGALAGRRVIGRDLTKDFAGGRGVNELVSARSSGGGSGRADRFVSLTQDGALATFASDDRVDEFNDADDESDVYWSQRRGVAVGAPEPVDFGTVKVGTSSAPVPFTVTNTGTTAVRYDRADIYDDKQFALAGEQCTRTTIHPGQSCTFLLKFTPSAIGLRSSSGSLPQASTSASDGIALSLRGRGASDARVAGETRHVSTNSADHLDPAISDSGRLTAYRTRTATGDSVPTQINVRDQATSEIRTVGRHFKVGPPRISGDGTRIVYNADELGSDVTFVASPAGSRQVTGTASDLRYQRPCYFGHQDRSCRPDISQDGRTIAIPARLDARTDFALGLHLEEFDGQLHNVRTLLDLNGGGTKKLHVTADKAVKFASKPSIDTGSGFWVAATTCDGELAKDATCTVDVQYDACAGPGNGVLRLNGATPEAQGAIALVANNNCVHLRSAPKVKAAADCTPIDPPARAPSPSTATTTGGNIVADADDTLVGTTKYLAVRVPAAERSFQLHLLGGCDFTMVTPAQADPNEARACVNGEMLPAGVGCTAYVGYRPSTVDVASAYLIKGGAGDTTPLRFVGNSYQDVVLTRADTAGDATFAETPEIATKDSGGTVVIGNEPSLSADGRYLAFTGALLSTDPEVPSTTQIYRRDRTAGQLALVSLLADGKVGTDDAREASLSATGDRVAFHTDGVSPPESAKRGAQAAADQVPHPSRIWVRDIPSGKSVLASAAKPGEDSNGWSRSPALSDDGTTVGFASSATDLVAEPGNDEQAVYVRYLEPDFENAGERFTERVSVNEEGAVLEDGASQTPTLSADGAFTAFTSTSDLVAGTEDDGRRDIFVRRRLAQLTVTPTTVDFGAVQVGKSSSAREMVVKNLGNGPVVAGPSASAAPFVAGANRCQRTLHRGQSCTIDARFAPTAGGPAHGTLTLPSKQGYLDGPSAAVGLTGRGTAATPVARFSVVPGTLVFPATEVGKSSSKRPVKLQNTGDVPLTITAALKSPDFAATLEACTTVMPGASCDVPVTFAPRAAGARQGSVVFTPASTDPAVKSPAAVTVGLSGTGTPGAGVASMTVVPQALVFGPQVLSTASAPKSVVVTNTGTVPLTLSAVSAVTDFRPTMTCAALQPGKSCAIAVRFVPQLLGARAGVVQVAATTTGVVAPFPVPVKVSGTTLAPTLVVDPPVTRPGQIVLATGTNFPPGRPVVLGWDTGLGTQQAVADRTGKFTAAVLIFRRDSLGQRVLTGTVPGVPLPVQSKPVLVMPLSYQPPNFVLRW
ncbi:hypothetical protein GCM10009534_38450 [Kribbella sandramycini]